MRSRKGQQGHRLLGRPDMGKECRSRKMTGGWKNSKGARKQKGERRGNKYC